MQDRYFGNTTLTESHTPRTSWAMDMLWNAKSKAAVRWCNTPSTVWRRWISIWVCFAIVQDAVYGRDQSFRWQVHWIPIFNCIRSLCIGRIKYSCLFCSPWSNDQFNGTSQGNLFQSQASLPLYGRGSYTGSSLRRRYCENGKMFQ